MRVLITHCKEFQAINSKTKEKKALKDSIVVLISVEEHDENQAIVRLVKEIKKSSKENNQTSIALFPFAHLSNKLASPAKAKEFVDKIKSELTEYEVIETPFGVSKEILLHIHGHEGNVKYREF